LSELFRCRQGVEFLAPGSRQLPRPMGGIGRSQFSVTQKTNSLPPRLCSIATTSASTSDMAPAAHSTHTKRQKQGFPGWTMLHIESLQRHHRLHDMALWTGDGSLITVRVGLPDLGDETRSTAPLPRQRVAPVLASPLPNRSWRCMAAASGWSRRRAKARRFRWNSPRVPNSGSLLRNGAHLVAVGCGSIRRSFLDSMEQLNSWGD